MAQADPMPPRETALEDTLSWTGSLEEFPLSAVLQTLAKTRSTGTLWIQPVAAGLHLREGRLQAVSGLLPLGDILLARGQLEEEDLAEALKRRVRPLGQALLQQGLGAEALREALSLQVHLGIAFLLHYLPGQAFHFRPTPPLPPPEADLEITPLLLEWLRLHKPLPLSAPVELAPQPGPVHLDEEAWRLVRLVNGRRSLANVLRFSGLHPKRAWEKAEELLHRGLLRPSALFGLRLIVPARAPRRANYHPPSSLMANLFLKWVNGERTAAQIGEILGLKPQETALYLVDLFREGLIEVAQGRPEMERLADDF
ncbi:hypothetical protein TCCBUS3UF1_290 [Thermus sp. CCB_US3_UF1]|uniref:DUF4388 domain-containing protein n=1 Tax=Thermus sp. CCB_US3_UF1 TaxID=1111069 RepID=UPI000238A1CE|nr:DUF4388 domain-containing protein [Thermus sp. CCB_US3_UF1]AEV15079.1 hypothetical protein TCCBUS3UF1_290 [Thermus sp. CCB_US3_UF1]